MGFSVTLRIKEERQGPKLLAESAYLRLQALEEMLTKLDILEIGQFISQCLVGSEVTWPSSTRMEFEKDKPYDSQLGPGHVCIHHEGKRCVIASLEFWGLLMGFGQLLSENKEVAKLLNGSSQSTERLESFQSRIEDKLAEYSFKERISYERSSNRMGKPPNMRWNRLWILEWVFVRLSRMICGPIACRFLQDLLPPNSDLPRALKRRFLLQRACRPQSWKA